ncbi:MAG: 7TM domain-containing protein, partial [Candidatus Peribacteraceae bacterium]|nr:7TM domain-containing protein [Candidatus Peribacteraceae bacterium]
FHLVVRTEIDGKTYEARTERTITVYERKIVLIADPAIVTEEKLAGHRKNAAAEGTYLLTLQPPAPATPLGMEAAIAEMIATNKDAFTGAEAVVLWTDGVSGLQALMRAVEASGEPLMQKQTLVLIQSRGLKTLARMTRGPFAVLNPDRILITRKEAINPLLSAQSTADFITELEQRDIDLIVVDKTTMAIRPWNLLSVLVNFMLTHGVSSQIVILLLILPVIAMILTFLKQVIGITTFGLFTPSIVALSFLALGWKVGVIFLLLILITGYATRACMKRWRLLHVPKVAIVLTVVSVTLLLLLGLAAAFSITFGQDTIFILLIMSTLAESFLSLKAEEGWFSALSATTETILAALLCVLIVQWALLQSLILAYPELILLTIIVDVILGRWTGLRLVEYFRFREVFRHLQEE